MKSITMAAALLLVTAIFNGTILSQEHNLELKGYRIGMSLGEFRQMRTGSVWIAPNGKKSKSKEVNLPLCSDQFRAADMNPKPGEVVCETTMGERGIEAATFAGRRAVTNTYTFREGKLEVIRITFRCSDFGTVLEAFAAKFGPPELSAESYQNGYGAKWEGHVARWSRGGSTMIFREGPGNGPGQNTLILSEMVLASDQELLPDKPKIDF